LLAADGQCVCLSGFSGEDCSIAASCSAATASATQADNFPTLDLTSATYTQNTLRVSLLGPYVTGRRYNAISFVGQNITQCSLGSPSSFWSTNFTSGCEDLFHIDLPWIFHADCGFAPNQVMDDDTMDLVDEDNQTAIAEHHFISYTSKFTLYYTDLLGAIENITLTRNTSVPYQIYVRFPTRLDVSLSNVNIQSIVELGFALTEDTFDADSGELTIEITVINTWPNMLEYNAGNWNWPAIKFPAQVGLLQANDSSVDYYYHGVQYEDGTSGNCANVEGSACRQAFRMSFNTTGCTYDGVYNFSIPVFTCRGGLYYDCTYSDFIVSFDMSTSSICSQIGVNLTLAGTLVPFLSMYSSPADPANPFYNQATSGFVIGSYGYFQVVLDNPDHNTISLDFYEISFQANGLTNVNYLMKDHVVQNNDTYAPGNADSSDAYHYDEANLTVWNDQKGFRVYFSSVVFKVQPSTMTVYTFRASAYVTYQGNEGEVKREVDFVWEAEANQVSSWAKFNLAPAALSSKQSVAPVGSSNIAYIVGGGGAGLVLIVLAVIGLAIRHQKKQAFKRLSEATRA